MKKISRRDFMQMSMTSTLALPLIGLGCKGNTRNISTLETLEDESAKYIDEIGFQVFTLRDALIDDSANLFKSLAEVGIKNIEFFDPATLNEYVPIVKDNGMVPLATHFMPGYISGNWETAKAMGMEPPENYYFENILEDSNKNEIKNAGIAIMLDEERETLDHYRRFAEEVNIKAEQARSAGIQLYYHNHNFEFEMMEGSIPYEEMLDIFDPELVKLELDVFWVTVGGQDPIHWLQRTADRLLFLHVKDLKEGSQLDVYDIPYPDESFTELGTGILDWNTILAETRKTGVQYAIIDQDHTQMENSIDSVRTNVEYIRSLGI